MKSAIGGSGPRLAVIATHPIQYFAPWFTHIVLDPGLNLRVFYLWDFGVAGHLDQGFQVPVTWDVPLLEGYAHEFVPNRSTSPGTDRYSGLWNPDLPARLRAWRPDAILLTAYNYASFGYLMLRWSKGEAPLIFRGDSHRLVPRSGWLAAVKQRLLERVFSRISAFLYVGAANKAYYRLHGVPEDRLFHSPHAVDNARFLRAAQSAESEAREWKRSLGIPEGRRVVLFAGKFEDKKRPMDLLQAFRAARLEDAVLLFVGSGPLETQLRAAVAGAPDVFFAPFQNQTLMPRTYAAGDVFVLPSFGPSETWGLAVNEAMCMARPAIVSTHVGCAADLVVPRSTGLTFEAGNIEALRDALKEAFSDSAQLRDWGMNARRRIEDFDYAHASAGLLSALDYAIARRYRQ